MVEVHEDIVEKLKCTECKRYLSCSPVLIRNYDNFCGRCSVRQESSTHPVYRNVVYENLAKMMSFPCSYKYLGCDKQLPWNKVKYHEDECQFREYKCPSDCCSWSGNKAKLLRHYQDVHEEFVVENPFQFALDITKDCDKNYLLPVFGFLFIIQIRYALAETKIWCSSQLIGNQTIASYFEYCLRVTRKSFKVEYDNTVLPYNATAVNVTSCIEIGLSSLLEILKGFDNTLFTVSLNAKPIKCISCGKKLAIDLNQSLNGDFFNLKNYCEECEQKTLADQMFCKNQDFGCKYMNESKVNLMKHETWCCQYSSFECTLCFEAVSDKSRLEHFKNCRNVLISDKRMSSGYLDKFSALLIMIHNTCFFCSIKKYSDAVEVNVVSELPKEQLRNFKIVALYNALIHKRMNDDTTSSERDWFVQFSLETTSQVLELDILKMETEL
ncbi:seven in absentia [Carabus blaptoides fortunei]